MSASAVLLSFYCGLLRHLSSDRPTLVRLHIGPKQGVAPGGRSQVVDDTGGGDEGGCTGVMKALSFACGGEGLTIRGSHNEVDGQDGSHVMGGDGRDILREAAKGAIDG